MQRGGVQKKDPRGGLSGDQRSLGNRHLAWVSKGDQELDGRTRDVSTRQRHPHV